MIKPASILLLLLLVGGSAFGASELPDPVQQALARALEAEWGAGQVQWSLERAPSLSHMADADRWELELSEQPRGDEIIQVVLYEDERVVRRVPIRIRVMPFAWVPVAAEELGRGRALSVGTFTWQRREVTNLRRDWPAGPEEFAGMALRTRRNLDEGDIITWGSVERAPAVGNGEPVLLTLREGSVVIETEGTALQDGYPGDVIRVEPADLPRLLQARVTGRGAAEILGALGRGKGHRE